MKKGKSLNLVRFDTDSELYAFENRLKKMVISRLKITIHPRTKNLKHKRKVLKIRQDFVFQIFKSPKFGIVTCTMCNKVKNNLPYHKKLCKQCYNDDENKDWNTW